jgi:ribose-phosphate pyrophosphokinase
MQLTRFKDGEWDVKIAESVRGHDVFLVQPTCQPVSENLIQLFIILDALHRASAARVTAVIPYYAYARKEKKTAPRDPISAKLMANMISLAGANRVIALDLHADAIQGFFDIPVDHLFAAKILAEHIRRRYARGDFVVVAPDLGGTKRARYVANQLEAPMVFVDKRRPRDDVAEVLNVVGDVDGLKAVVIEDIISTGTTLVGVATALCDSGASAVDVLATHGVLSDGAMQRLAQAPIDQIVVTDSIPIKEVHDKLVVLSVAPLLAEGIRRVHEDRSVSELFRDDPALDT